MEGGDSGDDNREKFDLSMSVSGFSSDLLKRCLKRSRNPDGLGEVVEEEEEEEEEEEIELSLGLSLNGRFGVDPTRKKLHRSSSISNLVYTVAAAENGAKPQARDLYAPPLPRTRSLPTEAEEEWRRRKEFQSMRRMEARKKRMEKLKNVRVMKDKDVCVEDVKDVAEVINENGVLFSKPENGSDISSSQGSIGSQRSGSSGISDIEFHPKEGPKQNGEVPPPQDVVEEDPAGKGGDRYVKVANPVVKNAMLDMPYVATRGDGPNGRRIEGFLYRYKKGEEVRIVCVCHGQFLTPAEFVKHGGGGDVEHPLKHIVVNPFPLL